MKEKDSHVQLSTVEWGEGEQGRLSKWCRFENSLWEEEEESPGQPAKRSIKAGWWLCWRVERWALFLTVLLFSCQRRLRCSLRLPSPAASRLPPPEMDEPRCSGLSRAPQLVPHHSCSDKFWQQKLLAGVHARFLCFWMSEWHSKPPSLPVA